MDTTGKLVRWILRLMEYAFDVIHSAGSNGHAGDVLSRLTTAVTYDSDTNDDTLIRAVATRAQ